MTTNQCNLKTTLITRLIFAAALFSIHSSQLTLHAQEVISTSGKHHESADKSISWTLGEMVTETFSAGENILTQGFHQSKLTVVSMNDMDLPGYTITAYPSPAKSYVTLSVEAEKYENMVYRLYDLNGKLITQGSIDAKNTSISFSGLKPAVYFLRVIDDQKNVRSIKIIKN